MGVKKATSKKKAPKGKKARAKAKLDRQWGEVVDEQEVERSRLRRGKSRVLNDGRVKQRNTHERISPAVDNEAEPQPNSSDDSDDDDEEQKGSLSHLLESINKKSRSKRKEKQTTEAIVFTHDDEESENEMDVDENLDEDSSASSEESDESILKVDEEYDVDDLFTEASEFDPFSSHFNHDPLPEQGKERSRIIDVSQKTSKLSAPMLSHSLDAKVSPSFADILNPQKNGSDLEKAWLVRATELFACNRKALKQGWKRTNASVLRRNPDGSDATRSKKYPLSMLQCAVYPSLATYDDVLITAERRMNRDALDNIVCLHMLNHVLTSRGRIQRNNKKIKQLEESEEEGGETLDMEKLRDQGFTRPSVLVLLPTRGTCRTFVTKMLCLLGDAAHVDSMDRFEAEYGPPPADETEDDKSRQRRNKILEAKRPEWRELFGDGANGDDDFKIGVTVTPKAVRISKKKEKPEGGVSFKLYSDFYRSDIIIASPLGLKMSTEASEDEEPNTDFLSSIEICLVARSDVLLMQNWDHVNAVLDLLNQQPKNNNDTDFSRVRHYHLAGQAEHWRQLIVTSTFSDPHIISTFKHHGKSIAGRLKLTRRTPVDDASLYNVLVKVNQVFERIPCNSFANQGNDRLHFFEQRILPQIRERKQNHTMIFIPSYFDFVSVRNLLLRKEVDFASVTEYSRVSEVSRGRARFLQGLKPLLLYTGRAHFFNRHAIKGVRHLILYGLPEHAEFYAGLVNTLNDGLEQDDDMEASTTCLALFTKFDALALERTVGSPSCSRMIKGEKSTYMFCS